MNKVYLDRYFMHHTGSMFLRVFGDFEVLQNEIEGDLNAGISTKTWKKGIKYTGGVERFKLISYNFSDGDLFTFKVKDQQGKISEFKTNDLKSFCLLRVRPGIYDDPILGKYDAIKEYEESVTECIKEMHEYKRMMNESNS